jgi:hypothetical protein
MSDEVKFPLTKKAKQQFSEDYEKIFLKKPANSLKEEKLVELVNANRDKITPDAKTNQQSSQEGIQDEENETSKIETNDNDSNESNSDEGNSSIDTSGEFVVNDEDQAVRSKEQQEREYQFNQYKQLYGEEADGELSTDEVMQANISKMNYNAAVKVYFDLFGKRPLEDMTTDQILSVIANEESRQAVAKAEAAKKASPSTNEFDYNPETEMLIVNKKDKKDKRVINKVTFPFLKETYDAVSETPKELLNKK